MFSLKRRVARTWHANLARDAGLFLSSVTGMNVKDNDKCISADLVCCTTNKRLRY